MNSVTKKKVFKLIIMWLVSIAVLALAYFTVVFPIHLEVTRKSNEITQMGQELKRMRVYVSDDNYNRLKEQRASLANSLDRFVAVGSAASESTYVIADIAGDVGVAEFTTKDKTTKQLSQIQNCKLLKRALVDVSCKGTYMKFLRLINEYERSSPVVLIDKFTVTAIERGENKIKMSLLILVDKQSDDMKI